MIVEKYKKISLFFTFVIFFLSYWLIVPVSKVLSADCTSGCDTNGSGSCVWDWGLAANNFLADRKTCAVGAAYEDVWDLGDGWETSCDSDSGTKKCETEKCPASTVNGAVCTIVEPSGSFLSGCVKNEITGKWDITGSKCVLCTANKKEGGANSVCGNTTQILTNGAGVCTESGDSLCESACGASSQCDERPVDYVFGGNKCDADCQWVSIMTATPTPTITPTISTTSTLIPTGTPSIACPTLPPNESCANPGAKAINKYDYYSGQCKAFPEPCELAQFCENGVCKEPKSIVAMLTDGVVFLLSLVIGLAILVILFGGFRYMASGGDYANIDIAKKIIYYGLFGLIISGLSYAIVRTIYGLINSK